MGGGDRRILGLSSLVYVLVNIKRFYFFCESLVLIFEIIFWYRGSSVVFMLWYICVFIYIYWGIYYKYMYLYIEGNKTLVNVVKRICVSFICLLMYLIFYISDIE